MARACVLTEYGPPDVLKWEDVPMPEPSAAQIRIKVRVSGVSPTDLKIRHGDVKEIFPLPEPPVLGFETAGTVDAVGEEATGVAVGDEVAALGKGGLQDAIALTGGTDRVITLADPRAPELGVRFSVGTPDGAPDAVDIGMELVASGELRLRPQRSLPMSQAAEAHRLLENGHAHEKVVLVTEFEKGT